MQNSTENRLSLFYIGLLIIFMAILVDYFDESILPVIKMKSDLKKVQHEVIESEKQILKVFESFHQKQYSDIYNNYDYLIALANKNNIYFYIFYNNNLVLWTSNKIVPELIHKPDKKLKLVLLENGYYLQMNQEEMGFTIIALKLIQTNYPIQNKYLVNSFQLGKKSSSISLIKNNNNHNNEQEIFDLHNNVLFSIDQNIEKTKRNWVFVLYLLGGFLLLVFIHRQINYLIKQKNIFHATIIFIATLTISVLGWRVFRVPSVLFRHELFSPEVYASSYVLSSIGDLFVAVFLCSWTILIITSNFHSRYRLHANKRIIILIAFYVLSLFLIKIISGIIKGIIINSGIPTDMSELLNFNSYSLIAFLIIFLILYSYIRLIFFFTHFIRKKELALWQWLIIFIIPNLIFLFIHRFNIFEISMVIQLLFVLICWLLFNFFVIENNQSFNLILSLILLCSGFTAHLIANANNNRQIEKRKHLISSIVSGRDALAEYLIINKVNEIKNDHYLKTFYSNPLISNELIYKRLKQVYFTGYLSNFDLYINTYDLHGLAYKSNDTLSMNSFMPILNSSLVIDNLGLVYFHNHYDGAPEYLIPLTITNNYKNIGQILIVLKKKTFQEDSAYPDLIIESNIKRTNELSKYSFAIYRNYQLINQRGSYAYPTLLFSNTKGNELYYILKESGYEHLVYNINDNITVILSNERTNIFTSLSLFSLLFILSTILYVTINYITNFLSNLDKKDRRQLVSPFSQLSFKQKIQITILISLLITFIISGYFTINLMIKKSNDSHYNKLQQELKIVSEKLNDYSRNVSMYSDDINEEIKSISEQFKIDINVFDRFGYLITSSQMSIYDRKIISRIIDANAFNLLWLKKKSQTVDYETIGGKLKFFSAYMPLRNDANEIVGFINIPYYSKELAIQNEVSSLLVTFINLYVFLFLLSLLVSIVIATTFTEPLEIIKKHLSDVRFGISNQKITYNSADEIGALVTEYNRMIDNVERSAEALSRTEREMAWKEMAQQIAHEIKNPLTPMKLNLQQLLRAWNDKSPDLEERFRKTTEILINRIESLSDIATEFSEFARMPEPKGNKMVINDVVIEIVDLYTAVERVTITTDIPEQKIIVFADYQQIIRAMNNLVRNAFQAIPQDQKGQVTISLKETETDAVIEIRDTGSGINPELKDKIFLPNFSTKSSGMGLGLAIVDKIIKSANGKIWFETEEGKGTSFYFSLPLLKDSETVS